MSASATIILDSKADVLLVPSGGVSTLEDTSTVQVMKSGKPQVATVEIGLSSDTQTEITSGLSEGDIVVNGTTAGASNNSPGQTPSPVSVFGGGNRFGSGSSGAVRIIR